MESNAGQMADVVQLLIQGTYTAVTVLLVTEYRHPAAALPSSWHCQHPYPPAYFIQLRHCRHCWACKRDACCPMRYLLSPLRSLGLVQSTGTSCRCSLNLTQFSMLGLDSCLFFWGTQMDLGRTTLFLSSNVRIAPVNSPTPQTQLW